MTVTQIDLRDQRPALSAGTVSCHSCTQAVPTYEIFDGWDTGRSQDDCPRCFGRLLPPLVTA